MKYRILVVDDEDDLLEILSFNLLKAGYEVVVASSAEEALELDLNSFNLILLDVMMGNMSGFDMMKLIKSDNSTLSVPVIFLTAKDSEDDMLKGFGLGADDYISKPFSVKEVLARVKAVICRTTDSEKTDLKKIFKFKSFSLDFNTRTAYINKHDISLTKTEFELLKLFVNNPDKVFTRHELMVNVWPQDVIVTDRTVDVNITRLRKKLGEYSDLLCTRQGFGYFFSINEYEKNL